MNNYDGRNISACLRRKIGSTKDRKEMLQRYIALGFLLVQLVFKFGVIWQFCGYERREISLGALLNPLRCGWKKSNEFIFNYELFSVLAIEPLGKGRKG